jgi:hypothetical protein
LSNSRIALYLSSVGKPGSRAKVQTRLEAEAGAFNASHRGFHKFSPIWQVDDPVCNWTASFETRGSSLSLSELRAVLERVQARMPLVDWGIEARS